MGTEVVPETSGYWGNDLMLRDQSRGNAGYCAVLKSLRRGYRESGSLGETKRKMQPVTRLASRHREVSTDALHGSAVSACHVSDGYTVRPVRKE